MRLPILPMRYEERGFGLFQWTSDDVCIAGGIRVDGYHPPGQMRLGFHCFGVPEFLAHGEEEARIGYVELIVNLGKEPTVDGLVRIEVDKDKRRQRNGERILAGVMAVCAGDLKVYDIQVEADGWWRRMGLEFAPSNPNRPQDGILRRPAPELDEAPTLAP